MGVIRLGKATTLLAAVLLMALATACGGDGSGSNSLIPQRATSVGSVEFGQLAESTSIDLVPVFQWFASASASTSTPDRVDGLYALDEAAAFILSRDIGRVDLFSEGDPVVSGDYIGVVVAGNFDEIPLIAELEAVSGSPLLKEVYKGINVYSQSGDPDGVMMSVLDGETFVVGADGALNDVIDLWVGDAKPASGPLIDAFDDQGDGVIKLALDVSEDTGDGEGLSSIPQLQDLPISLDFMSSLEILALSGDLDAGTLDLTVTMDFADRGAADSLKRFLDGIVGLASAFSADQDTADLVAGLSVEQDGRSLTIEAAIPASELTDLFTSLTEVASATSTIESFAEAPAGTPEIKLLDSVVGERIAIMPSANHVPEGQKVDYSTTPPTSGMHWGRWADCGWYPDGQPDEVTTHNLEHGNIVVSYNFTNPAQVTELRQVLDGIAQFENWGVARSYDKIPEGQVALAAWGRLHTSQGVAAVEIEQFFSAFAGLLGPERVPC